MGGYSILANRGVGFRTRLKARIVYLNDGKGSSVALVQTDLTAASLLLHHKVAAAVAERTHLKPGDIAITASHSHSTPVNFFDNDFYNEHTSSGSGLEPHFLEFAVQRVAQGILEAYEARRPARVATGRKDIYGYNRNRSLSSYVLNENVGDMDLDDPQAVFRAVNPALYMVRVDVRDDQGRYKPLAAFSSFSVHATALTPPVQVYNADLFAYAQRDLEWAIQRKYGTPWSVVHAMTAGTQGDMAPALPDRGDNTFGQFPVNWKEARELGQAIGREAVSLFESVGRNAHGRGDRELCGARTQYSRTQYRGGRHAVRRRCRGQSCDGRRLRTPRAVVGRGALPERRQRDVTPLVVLQEWMPGQ